jgi:hypothetical protein
MNLKPSLSRKNKSKKFIPSKFSKLQKLQWRVAVDTTGIEAIPFQPIAKENRIYWRFYHLWFRKRRNRFTLRTRTMV